MDNLILSPMQQNYITKEEFGEFKDGMCEFRDETNQRFIDLKEFVDDGFEATNGHIDNLEIIMNKRFDKVDERFDAVDARFDSLEARMDNKFNEVDKNLRLISEQLVSLNVITDKIAVKLL